MFRWVALGLAAAVLSGCANMVYSDQPLFSKEDARGAPVFRPGVWADVDEDCQADLTAPVSRWPNCANGFVVGRKGTLQGKRVILAAGDPAIMQDVFGAEGEPPAFLYVAVRPLERDEAGRVVKAEFWNVVCGPPPPKIGDTDEPRLTLEPLPGLEVRGDKCLARDPDTVRRAATASRTWDGPPSVGRWVRAGTR